MKRTLFLFLLTLTLSSAFGEVLKCRATSMAYKSYNENLSIWNKWSLWEDVNILIAIDGQNGRIKIFSSEEQVYDIIEFIGQTTDTDGDETWKWRCLNADGLKCDIRLVKLYSHENQSQIYIDFADFMFAYNVLILD